MNFQENLRHGKFPLPMIGNRILKTAAAVFLCLLIYRLRGYQGGVSESCITAVICMQPYAKDARKSARDRILGTVLGGFWGLAFLLLVMRIPTLPMHMLVIYILIALGVIVAVYSCVVLNISESAALAAIVFICLVVNYPQVDPSITQTLLNILDTIIGVLVAVFVNSFQLPTRKRTDRIFFLQLNDLAADRYSYIPSRVLTELNRLYDAGAKICLETPYAPAFLIGQLQMLHINMPVIVLGGAAMYDIRENIYLEVQEIPFFDSLYLQHLIETFGYCSTVFTLRGNSMLLFLIGERSPQEEENYRMMRRSPYRNYMEGSFGEEDRVLAFRMILEDREMGNLEEKLSEVPDLEKRFHILRMSRPRHPGETLIYFYRKGVSLQAAEEHLMRLEQEKEQELNSCVEEKGQKPQRLSPVRIRPLSRRYDPDRDSIELIHRIRHLYQEPFWKRRPPSEDTPPAAS